MKRYVLDYTFNTSINVKMVDYLNAGITEDEILKVVNSMEYVNCARMCIFSSCEITFYTSVFNREVIDYTVKEIQNQLNCLC